MDMILTGRPVDADEALAMGLANRVVPAGTALAAAQELAARLAAFPQACMRSDRASVLAQWASPDPLATEFAHGGGHCWKASRARPVSRRARAATARSTNESPRTERRVRCGERTERVVQCVVSGWAAVPLRSWGAGAPRRSPRG